MNGGGQAGAGRPLRLRARLSTLMARLRQVARWVSPVGDPAYAAEVRNEQNLLLARTSCLFAVFGSSSVATLALDFRSGLGACGILACLAIPALYGMLIALVGRWRQDGDGIGFHRRSLVCLAALGVLWGVLLVMLSGGHDVSQQRMVAALLIGLVSTPVMAAPFSAALAFWVPGAASALVALCGRQDPFDIYLLAGTVGYLAMTFLGMVVLNRSLLESSTSRIRLLQQNRTISLFLRDYEENASDWLWETDAALRFCHASPRFAQAALRPAAELNGRTLFDLFCHTEDTAAGPSEAPHALRRMLDGRAAFRDLLVPVAAAGDCRWWSLTGQPHYDARAQFQGYRGIGSDRTEVVRAEARIRYMATHDSLTGLANRQRLLDTLQAACDRHATLPRAAAGCGGECSLLMLDLDRFKAVNDGFGHAAGDALLIAVAERLRELVGEGDLVARLGGDEFAILMPSAGEPEATALAARIIERLSQPFLLPEARVTVGASVGVTLLPRNGTDTVGLLRSADLALYAAKSHGRGQWRLFQPRMQDAGLTQSTMQAELRAAIETGALFLEFQPILRLPAREVVSVEALLRWRHPARGVVSPMEFIPLAEDTGLIARIGLVALREACRAAASWPDGVRLAVNVSPHQLRNLGLPEMVDAVLAESGLAASRLELEITETAVLDATPQILAMLHALGERGIRLVLDDFGTGHSSLNHLREFRLDGLKLSAGFVHGLEHDRKTAAIVAAVALLADGLAIAVTAEGVETDGQLARVQAHGIGLVQGFLFSRPLDAAGIGALLWRGALEGQDTKTLHGLGTETTVAAPQAQASR
jgi:diguanylate cyclase (GGDEF)-like protein